MAKRQKASVSPLLHNPVPGRSIEEHGLVGNLETAALVALDGTIDFMCWPNFDSPTVFAALLDPDNGGCFELAPMLEEVRTAQLYLPDTNVLMTRWLSETGSAELDYRATWLRDASFTIYAFMRLGYVDEAERFRRWMSDRAKGAVGGELRIMFALNGDETPDETELDHLAGYGGARPVRIGNAAHKQRQLDVYGELIDSIYLANKYRTAVSHEAWGSLSHSIDSVCAHWRKKDSGIWEMRGAEQHFLHSR
jgi:GH15 family glucan-1,4-alpha-glucosidase